MPVRKIPKLISKSKLMRGYQCLKQIYLTVHHPQFEAPITPEKQAIFDQGNEVGALARTYFPGGVLVDFPPWDFVGSLKKTRELLEQEAPVIYEAAFEYKGCYARTDIIQYQADTERWKIFEVKSSTSVKDEQLQDIALQAWILAKAGLPIEQINLVHLNRECVFPELKNLFKIVDVTEEVRKLYKQIESEVTEIVQCIRQDDIPDIHIGRHCMNPYECGFKDHCFAEAKVPELSIFDLPRLGEKKWEYIEQGKYKIAELSEDDRTETIQRIIDAHTNSSEYLNREAIQSELSQWKYPLRFLDFETIQYALPKYIGTRPYDQVAFQYSLHTLNKKDAPLEHSEFLWDQDADPRPKLIEQLIKDCGDEGSIVAYYATFEKSRIKEMAESFPEYSQPLMSLIDRFVDPLPVIRDNVYKADFQASFSLKKVGPALLGKEASYEDLEVGDGLAAQRAYKKLIIEKDPQIAKKIKSELLEYCEKDTELMVHLYNKLLEL